MADEELLSLKKMTCLTVSRYTCGPFILRDFPAMCGSTHVQVHYSHANCCFSHCHTSQITRWSPPFFLKRREDVPLRQILYWILWIITDIDDFVCNRSEKQFSFFFFCCGIFNFFRKICQ